VRHTRAVEPNKSLLRVCQAKGQHREASQLRHTTGRRHGDESSCAGGRCHDEEIDLSYSKGQQLFFGDNMATGEVCDG